MNHTTGAQRYNARMDKIFNACMEAKAKAKAVKVGDRVRLTEEILHTEFKGMTGTVKKVIKSRNVIAVMCDNGKRYDAYPQNVELIQG